MISLEGRKSLSHILLHLNFHVCTCALCPIMEIWKHQLCDTTSDMACWKARAQMNPL